MVTLRFQAQPSELFYAGAATYWDPPPHDREFLRAVARRVGQHLRHTVEFRGAALVW